MSASNTYLLKQRIPVDRHSGFDLHFMRLCPFIDEVFYVKERASSPAENKP